MSYFFLGLLLIVIVFQCCLPFSIHFGMSSISYISSNKRPYADKNGSLGSTGLSCDSMWGAVCSIGGTFRGCKRGNHVFWFSGFILLYIPFIFNLSLPSFQRLLAPPNCQSLHELVVSQRGHICSFQFSCHFPFLMFSIANTLTYQISDPFSVFSHSGWDHPLWRWFYPCNCTVHVSARWKFCQLNCLTSYVVEQCSRWITPIQIQ